MGSKAKEKGVLKLVHPGGFVEIHKKPITAAEVLKKNPRHSVTRPDVFEYPWIVVKPESVLNLGKVFYIVPNHTIYNLLKAHTKKNQHSPCRSQPATPKNHVHIKDQRQELMQKSDAGMTPKHRNNHRLITQLLLTISCIGATSPDQLKDSDDRLRKQSKVDSWLEANSRCKNTHLEINHRPEEDVTSKIIPFQEKSNHHNDTDLTAEVHRNDNSELDVKYDKQVMKLKSCLKKQDGARKSLQLKVSFQLPFKEEEQQRRDEPLELSLQGVIPAISQNFHVHCINLVPSYLELSLSTQI